jgi:hypothetical protein
MTCKILTAKGRNVRQFYEDRHPGDNIVVSKEGESLDAKRCNAFL